MEINIVDLNNLGLNAKNIISLCTIILINLWHFQGLSLGQIGPSHGYLAAFDEIVGVSK